MILPSSHSLSVNKPSKAMGAAHGDHVGGEIPIRPDEGYYPEELTHVQAENPKKFSYNYQKYKDEQEKTKENFGVKGIAPGAT